MNPRLARVLEDKGIDLYFRDEIVGRERRNGWVGVADVACSRTVGGVAVPRRRRDWYHFAEVLHEVAHLERWRWLGKSPTGDNEVAVCQLALDIAGEYGFSEDVLNYLRRELSTQLSGPPQRGGE